MPSPCSQSANATKLAVKHPNWRTGFGSIWGGTATQCSVLPTSIPVALGCTTCSPSVQSCGFSCARFFCFDRDFDVDFFALLDFCEVDFCVWAIPLFLCGE